MEIEISGFRVLIDDEDWEKVRGYKWHADTTHGNVYFRHDIHYPGDRKHHTHIKLHRHILGLKKGDPHIVDHVSGNTLDNRKSNLRICTIAENNYNHKKFRTNTSGYRGVTWNKKRSVWVVYISMPPNGNKYLGDFLDKEEAARVYDRTAIQLRGEFARTNFPKENYIKE